MRKHCTRILAIGLFVGWGLSNAFAMPNFARKLDVPCSTCHTIVPRLNETGYKFRAAGFRLPENIGKSEEKKIELGDYFSGRIQAQVDAKRQEKQDKTTTNTNTFSFTELTLYPVSGAWGKYFGSLVELSFAPEEPAEVENAYIRFTKGDQKTFFTGRAGIFHPFEGYGASDRPATINRPLFQRQTANFNQNTFFTPWGFDQAGAEVGVDSGRFSGRATLFTGTVVRFEEGSLKAFAAQGGPLTKSTSLTSHNTPDVQLFGNVILNPQGGALSAHYYHGNLALPKTSIKDADGNLLESTLDPDNLFRNNFDRFAVYGSYPVMSKLLALGGFQQGWDHTFDPVTQTASQNTFKSRGVFAEGQLQLSDKVAPGFRYDWFDPAVDKTNNKMWAVVPYVNISLNNGFQVIAEYRHINAEKGVNLAQRDDQFQARFIFIK